MVTHDRVTKYIDSVIGGEVDQAVFHPILAMIKVLPRVRVIPKQPRPPNSTRNTVLNRNFRRIKRLSTTLSPHPNTSISQYQRNRFKTAQSTKSESNVKLVWVSLQGLRRVRVIPKQPRPPNSTRNTVLNRNFQRIKRLSTTLSPHLTPQSLNTNMKSRSNAAKFNKFESDVKLVWVSLQGLRY